MPMSCSVLPVLVETHNTRFPASPLCVTPVSHCVQQSGDNLKGVITVLLHCRTFSACNLGTLGSRSVIFKPQLLDSGPVYLALLVVHLPGMCLSVPRSTWGKGSVMCLEYLSFFCMYFLFHVSWRCDHLNSLNVLQLYCYPFEHIENLCSFPLCQFFSICCLSIPEFSFSPSHMAWLFGVQNLV